MSVIKTMENVIFDKNFLDHPEQQKTTKKFRHLIKTALHVNEDSIEQCVLCLYFWYSKKFRTLSNNYF